MRILMISDVYFPRVNGVSTSIQTFARDFTAKGHEVALIAPDYGSDPGSWARGVPLSGCEPQEGQSGIASDGFEVIRIPSRYLPLDPEDRILRPSRIRRHRPRLALAGYDPGGRGGRRTRAEGMGRISPSPPSVSLPPGWAPIFAGSRNRPETALFGICDRRFQNAQVRDLRCRRGARVPHPPLIERSRLWRTTTAG